MRRLYRPRHAVALGELVQQARLEEVGSQRVLEVVRRDAADDRGAAQDRRAVVQRVERQAERDTGDEVRRDHDARDRHGDVEQQAEEQAAVEHDEHEAGEHVRGARRARRGARCT